MVKEFAPFMCANFLIMHMFEFAYNRFGYYPKSFKQQKNESTGHYQKILTVT